MTFTAMVMFGTGTALASRRPLSEDREEVVLAEASVASFQGLDSSLYCLEDDENTLLACL